MKVEGKVCAVTGGASGLGAGAATVLVEAGCKVAVLDRDEERGTELAQKLGPNAFFHACDVTSQQSLSEAVKETVKRFGRLDVMVTCAGVAYPKQIIGKQGVHSLQQFELIMKINAYGTFLAAREAVGQFVTQEVVGSERGVIVMVSSVNAHDGTRGISAYAASKGFVLGMTLPMARDLGSRKIRVVTISPGLFNTPMGNAVRAEEVLNATPLGRKGEPHEFGEAVKFAIANGFLTGCEIRLDGGLRNPNL